MTTLALTGSRVMGLAALFCLVGCGNKESDVGFGGGGSNTNPYPLDDTGGSDGGADSEAPIITNLNITLEDYAELGDLIQIQVFYEDPTGDFPYDPNDPTAGGSMLIAVESEAGTDEDLVVDASEMGIFDDEGYVQAAVSPEDTSVAHSFEVTITDAAGNVSASASGQYTPAR